MDSIKIKETEQVIKQKTHYVKYTCPKFEMTS
jgi:hypothetical protein